MANPLVRFFAQVGLSVATVVGKAFGKAYQNAAAEAAANKAGRVGAGASAANKASQNTASSWQRSKMMRPDEAYKVLNVDPKAGGELQSEIQQSFDKLFRMNDVTVGGSFYLQSKVYRAKQTLDRIHKPTSGAGGGTAAGSTSASAAAEAAAAAQQQSASGSQRASM